MFLKVLKIIFIKKLMQKSSLIRQILTLKVEERRDLDRFLASPYHNLREDVRQLYRFIQAHLDKNWKGLTKEAAFSFVYPGQAFDKKKMHYLQSFLLKAVEAFFIQEEVGTDLVRQQLFLLNAYRKRNLPKFFQKTLKRTRDFHQRSYRGIEHYELAYAIEWENYLFSAGQQRDIPSQLPVLNQTLDILFFCRRLKQSCLLQAHQAVFQEVDDPRLLQLIMNFLEDSPFLKVPLVAVYYYYLKAVQEPETAFFYQEFKQYVLREQLDLPKEERRTLILLAINYCIQRFNHGQKSFLREVFELYQAGLADASLLENGRLSRFAFKNIVGIGLRLEEFAWTEAFIRDFRHTLSPRYRDNYVHFSISKLRYTQRNYQEAMQQLLQVEYDDLYLNLDGKVMLMKMYYELDEWQALDSLLTSVKRFIQRKKLMGYHRESYLNIVLFIRKLLELNPYDKVAKASLFKEIEAIPALGEKEWLLEQLG